MPGFFIASGLIADIRYRLRRRYLTKTYAKRPTGYYDRRCSTYICPTMPEEDDCVEWVCGKLAGTCLVYGYCLNGAETHDHTFDAVLRAAYDHAKTFSIPEKYLAQYSAQELEFLQKLVERGVRDRRNAGP